jgi:hypothetical protein
VLKQRRESRPILIGGVANTSGLSVDHPAAFAKGLEQDIVDDSLVLIRDVRDRAGQRVDDVEVWRRE